MESKPVHELLDLGFASLQKSFTNNGVLDEFQTRGLFINWWNYNKFELRTIKESGWIQSLVSNFDFDSDEKKSTETTLEKVKYFFKERYETEISEIEALEEKESRLASEIEEASKMEELSDEDEITEPLDKLLMKEVKEINAQIKRANKITQQEYVAGLQKQLSEKESELAKIGAKKNALKQVQEAISQKNQRLLEKAQRVIDAITEHEAESMVMRKLGDSAFEILNTYLTAQKQEITAYFEMLWDKYGVDVRTLAKERDNYANELNKFLEELGYESD